jgi:S-adenosylmethionine uptake transporter
MSEEPATIEKQAALSTGKGIACMVAAGFMVSLQDAVTKWLTGSYPVGEVIFIRSLFVYLPVVLFVWREGGVRCLKTRRPGAQVLCCLFTVIATGLFVLSLSLLPLAEATAATFTSPIFVTMSDISTFGTN